MKEAAYTALGQVLQVGDFVAFPPTGGYTAIAYGFINHITDSGNVVVGEYGIEMKDGKRTLNWENNLISRSASECAIVQNVFPELVQTIGYNHRPNPLVVHMEISDKNISNILKMLLLDTYARMFCKRNNFPYYYITHGKASEFKRFHYDSYDASFGEFFRMFKYHSGKVSSSQLEEFTDFTHMLFNADVQIQDSADEVRYYLEHPDLKNFNIKPCKNPYKLKVPALLVI